MDMHLETRLKAALQNVGQFRTDSCLSETTIGRYADNALDPPERDAAEKHLCDCLYCLKNLNDMSEMLHYRERTVQVPQQLRQRLRELVHDPKPVSSPVPSLWERFTAALTPRPALWRPLALGLSAAWAVFLVSALVLRYEGRWAAIRPLSRDSIVNIQSLDEAGGVLAEQRGVAIAANGLIAANLSPLVGASTLRVTLRNGESYRTASIWKDEDRNLAVMKIDNDHLKAIPIGDAGEIVGKKIYVVYDSPTTGLNYQKALASGIRELPAEGTEGSRYIQVFSQDETPTEGAIVDDRGRVIGFLITEEKHVNLAVPAADMVALTSTAPLRPLSELQRVAFSGYAIDIYMKGILAKDAQRWDDAIEYLENAIRLNPHLDGAYVRLGHVYYRTRDFSKEQEVYEQALRVNPDNRGALFGLAENQVTRGQFKKAIRSYERLLARDAGNARVLYHLGLSYLAENQRSKAAEMCSRLHKLDPGQAELLERLLHRP